MERVRDDSASDVEHSETTPLKPTQDDVPTQEEYSAVLRDSVQSVRHWIIFSFVAALYSSGQGYVWILFAKSSAIGENSSFTIGLIYGIGGYIFPAIAGLIITFSEHFIEFDYWLVLGSVFLFVSNLLMTVSYEIVLYSIGSLIGWVAWGWVYPLQYAYISRMLPSTISVDQITVYYFSFIFAYIIGSSVAGLLAYFASFRSIFMVSTVISFFQIFHMVFIWKSEKFGHFPLLKRQKDMKLYYKNLENTPNEFNDDTKFPACIEKFDQAVEGVDKTIEWNICGKSLKTTYPILSDLEWKKLINVNISLAFNWAGSALLMTYYTVYCDKFFDVDYLIVISTAQIGVFSLFLLLGGIFVNKLFKVVNYEFKHLFIQETIAAAALILLLVAVYPYTHTIDLYWFYAIIDGITIGILFMVPTCILVFIQPKQHTAKVTALMQLLASIITGFGIIVVGIFWGSFIKIIFYASAFLFLCNILFQIWYMIFY